MFEFLFLVPIILGLIAFYFAFFVDFEDPGGFGDIALGIVGSILLLSGLLFGGFSFVFDLFAIPFTGTTSLVFLVYIVASVFLFFANDAFFNPLPISDQQFNRLTIVLLTIGVFYLILNGMI